MLCQLSHFEVGVVSCSRCVVVSWAVHGCEGECGVSDGCECVKTQEGQ